MIWSWLRQRPSLVDLGLFVLVLVPSLGVATRHPHPALGAALAGAQTVPLLFRRQRPVAVVTVVAALAVAMIVLGVWLLPLQLAIALYTLAAAPARRATWTVGPASIIAIALAIAIAGNHPEFGDLASRVVFLVAAWLFGDSLGSRRRYVREIEEKAERLERERDSEARRVVAEEQARIARELHDVVAHALSVIVVQAGAADEVFKIDPMGVEAPIRAIDTAARAALADLRRVLGILQRDAAYEPQPGLERIDGLISQVRATGLHVELEIEGVQQPVPVTVDLSAYRIIQEALTNTIKHAEAEHARVSIRYGHDLQLEIRDDGRGARNGHRAGHGLTGMRQRAAMLGGSVEAKSSPSGGYRVTARLPLGDALR
jgi:signal transduction histidine kinase